MKKLCFFLFFLIIALFLLAESSAAEYPDFETLRQSWGEDYPDYVTGIWVNGDDEQDYTLGVLDEKSKQTVLDQLQNADDVNIIFQKYSYNYLRKIQDEIDLHYYSQFGMYASGVNVYKNKTVIDIKMAYKGTPDTEKAIEILKDKYGDAIDFEYFEGEITLLDVQLYPDNLSKDLRNYIIEYNIGKVDSEPTIIKALKITGIISVALLFSFLIAWETRRRHSLKLQTVAGDTCTASPMTDKEIEALLRSSRIDYPSKLDAKILSEIDK